VAEVRAGESVNHKFHLGGNKLVSVTSQFKRVDIRSYWLPPDSTDLKPTRRGIGLTFEQWTKLSAIYFDCTRDYIKEEIEKFVPCYLKPDHAGGGAMACKECNPSFYKQFQDGFTGRQTGEKIPIQGREPMPITDMVNNWRDLPIPKMPLNQLQAMSQNLRAQENLYSSEMVSSEQAQNFARLQQRVQECLEGKSVKRVKLHKIESIVTKRGCSDSVADTVEEF
jgi:hypothetical protein